MSRTHDELVACLLSQPELLKNKARELLSGYLRGREFVSETIVSEYPVGRGFVDVAVLGYAQGYELGHQFALFIEVKSERESWTAGGVVRQLKNYQKSGDHSIAKLAFFCGRELTEAEAVIFGNAEVAVLR